MFAIIGLMLAQWFGLAAPFYAIYVQKEVGGSAVWIGVYIGVMMASNILSNLLSGWLSRRSGNRKVLVLGTSAGVTVSILMLALTLLAKPLGLSPQVASICLLPVFVLQGLRVNAVGISSPSLMLDLVPDAERSLMLGFTQTMMGLIILLTMLVGLVVDLAGYQVLMLISAAAYLTSLMLALNLKERHNA
ncbi:MAG: MFS transporter [Anaerolineaceae bacterium]|nr:MFS transporter [Anaerolineaceae bacterium]